MKMIDYFAAAMGPVVGGSIFLTCQLSELENSDKLSDKAIFQD